MTDTEPEAEPRPNREALARIEAELARLHARLDEYEPYVKRLIDNPLSRFFATRQRPYPGPPGKPDA